MLRRLKALFAPQNHPAWGVLLLCLVLTGSVGLIIHYQKRQQAEQRFDMLANQWLADMEARLRAHEQILLGARGLFMASDQVSRQEWREYVESLQLERNYPGIQGVGFSRYIPASEREQRVAAIRQEGFPDYDIRPPGERPAYTAIEMLEPFSGRNLAAFGFDMMSEPVRSVAMRRAAETGNTSMTGKVVLVQETEGRVQPGFLIYVPIYHRGMPLDTPEQRWAALQGFVYSPYRVGDLMNGITDRYLAKMGFIIYDGDIASADAKMYDVSDYRELPDASSPTLFVTRHVHAFGHQWRVDMHSHEESEPGSQGWLESGFLILGVIAGLLLFFLVRSYRTRSDQAEAMAMKMTLEIRLKSERLRNSEQQYRSLVASMPGAVYECDADARRTMRFLSSAIENVTGYPAADFIEPGTRSLMDLVHPHDRERLQESLHRSILVSHVWEVRYRLLHKDGGWRHVRERGECVFNQHGRPVILRGLIDDITANVLGEQSEQRQRAILEVINRLQSAFIVEADLAMAFGRLLEDLLALTGSAYGFIGEILQDGGKNPVLKMHAITNVSWDPLSRKLYEDHLETGMIFNRLDSLYGAVITSGEPVISNSPATDDRRCGLPPGHPGLECFIGVPYFLGGRLMGVVGLANRKDGYDSSMVDYLQPVLATIAHMIQAMRLERERERVERMKSEFVSTVSHELRTPLTSVIGVLSLLSNGVLGELPALARSQTDIALRNSQHLLSLINDLLDIEKIAAGKLGLDLRSHVVEPLIQQSIQSNSGYAEKCGVRFRLEELAGDQWIRVDAVRFRQVLDNLLSNAAKFSPADAEVLVSVSAHENRVRIEVRDSGCGIPEHFRERVFEKFSQGDSSDSRSKGGTGLGLAISRDLVERMGGQIGFESVEGRGTIFWCEFPAARPAMEREKGSGEENTSD